MGLRLAWLSCLMLVSISAIAAEPVEDWPADKFASLIRPTFSNACLHCHGPDATTREADLRLDTAEGIASVVDLDDPSSSELWRRLTSDDPDEQMPPPDSNKSLDPKARQALVEWVEAGAPWQQHWSFVAPHRPTLPAVQQTNWCRNDIDRFILQQLEQAGLQPSPMAPPSTLIRRLFLDLVGLPPTPEQTDTWEAIVFHAGSLNEEGYQRLVESLLSSPAYGERWGRRWLDLARYADTNGYEKDRPRSIWPYRDWVVSSLNRDIPFVQFTLEQLAGDLLPDATVEQQIATGFHRNTMLNEEGGIDPLEFRYHAMTDRVATTGTTWLGLTLGCCQCHSHKYDPISHSEYFQFMAMMNNANEPELELPNAAELESWQQNQQQAEQLLKQLRDTWPQSTDKLAGAASDEQSDDRSQQPLSLDEAFEQWLARERNETVAWKVLQPTQATASLPILTIEADQSIFASGDTAKRDDYEVTFASTDQPIYAFQLQALADDRLPARGPGTTYYEGTPGDFYLTEVTVLADGKRVPIRSASESYAMNRFGASPATATQAIDGDIQTGWAVDGRQGEDHVAVFVLDSPIPAGATVVVQMSFGRHFASSLGRFRVRAAHESRDQFVARDHTAEIEAMLLAPPASLNDQQRSRLLDYFLLQAPEVAEQSAHIRQLLKRPPFATTLVMRERPESHPRATHRHHRGEYLQAEEIVSPGVPQVLNPLPADSQANRLTLGQWLVHRDNPLTARVIVNRQWAAIFGTGIVKTVEDFGLQGEPPSHPELLDYLAVSWMDDDQWSLKALHRRIVNSATYMQSSHYRPEAATVDPENRRLSYFPRIRLDAEQLRDSLLIAAGTLAQQIGGPPVRPPQPAGITEVAFGSPTWNTSDGADRYRRSLYTFQKRTAPFAMLSTFDAPSGEACIARRTNSNSPLQALTMLNDVMVNDLADHAGQRLTTLQAASGTDDRQCATLLFRTALVRRPTEWELETLVSFYRRQLKAPNSDDEKETNDTSQKRRAMAWGATARAIFALDEFQTRE